MGRKQILWIRKLTVWILTVCVLAAGLCPAEVSAASAAGELSVVTPASADAGGPCGLFPAVILEGELSGEEEKYESGRAGEETGHVYYSDPRSAAAASEWDRYKNYYVYNQLSDAEREFWDVLDEICVKYMTTPVNAHAKTNGYHTDVARSTELSMGRMQEIAQIFRYSNPQYFFLNNKYYFLDDEKWLAFGVYTDFVLGGKRALERDKVKAVITAWQSEIDKCVSDAEKVQAIHDRIIHEVTYNYSASMNNEDKTFSQSAYSTFCRGTTVCAGYTLAFELLCNGSGIDAFAVTSQTHAWNKVRVQDSWFNVDCTWDDLDSIVSPVRYTYFERSDRFYDSDTDSGNRASHTELAMWNPYLPVCTFDTRPASPSAPGVLPTVTEVTADPVIDAVESETDSGSREVKITCSTNASTVYYTLDGTEPSPCATKSRKYTKPFVTDAQEVRAMAVCNQKWDSGVTTDRKKVPVYTVTYDGNGADSGSVESQQISGEGTAPLQSNGFKRRGHRFAGWNTAADGSGRSYRAGQGISGLSADLVLYACWEREKYAIVYHLNGGVNGDNPDFFYYDSGTITLKDPQREGYTFAGWYLDAGYKVQIRTFAKGTIGDRNVYARWTVAGAGSADGSGAGTGNGGSAGGSGTGSDGSGAGTGNGGSAGGSGNDSSGTGNDGSGAGTGSGAAGGSGTGSDVAGTGNGGAAGSSGNDGSGTGSDVAGTGNGTEGETGGSDDTQGDRSEKDDAADKTEEGTAGGTDGFAPKKGTTFTIKGLRYRVTGKSEVAFAGLQGAKSAKLTKVSVPATVKFRKKSYKVTSIAARALKNHRSVKTVSIGKNVKSIGSAAFSGCTKLSSVTTGAGLVTIGKEAFRGCKELKTLTIKSTKLKSVGKNAFRGIHPQARIKVPGKKLGSYKKLMKGKGQGSRVKIVKK